MRRPLSGLTIVDAIAGPLAPATRYLAELGADVIRVDPAPSAELSVRQRLQCAAANHGKRSCQPDEDCIGLADAVVVDQYHPLFDEARQLAERHPGKLMVICSDFGQGNECSTWQASDAVLHALTGELSRSGIRGKPPLLPPGELATQCAAVQLAYVTLVGLTQRTQTGVGDVIDFSMLEGAMQALDPGFGISGSATMGRPAHLLSPDRPPKGFQYPILPCADGHVRICLLAPRQWRGMFEWMGKPEQFSAPEFDRIDVRYKSPDLIPAIVAFFRNQTCDALEAAAKAHGVPLSASLTDEQALGAPHFRARAAFAPVALDDCIEIELPNGVIEIDGERMIAGPCAQSENPTMANALIEGLPLSNIKVLDLGIIVVGGEQGRLLADLGADVVKIESRAFPDGSRQTADGSAISPSFAIGHRNKRSLGLNLRSDEGKALFERLVAEADVILTNFKPGTMQSLGLGYDRLAEINRDVILVESSAFGPTGPWAKRMGYGPLVRAATGLTAQWRYPDDPDSFSDSVTIYPDHVGGRVTTLGVLALLLDRARAGRGGHLCSSQAEIVLSHQAWQIAAVQSGLADPHEPDDAPWGVFPTAGNDEWCAVTVRNNTDWAALCRIVDGLDAGMTRSDRLAHRHAIEARLTDWLGERTAIEAMVALQESGVPAGRMHRLADLPEFAAFRQRRTFRSELHPHLPEPFLSEAMIARSNLIAPPPTRPAPMVGEHSAEVTAEWLGLGAEEIAGLIERGVLEPMLTKGQSDD